MSNSGKTLDKMFETKVQTMKMLRLIFKQRPGRDRRPCTGQETLRGVGVGWGGGGLASQIEKAACATGEVLGQDTAINQVSPAASSRACLERIIFLYCMLPRSMDENDKLSLTMSITVLKLLILNGLIENQIL